LVHGVRQRISALGSVDSIEALARDKRSEVDGDNSYPRPIWRLLESAPGPLLGPITPWTSGSVSPSRRAVLRPLPRARCDDHLRTKLYQFSGIGARARDLIRAPAQFDLEIFALAPPKTGSSSRSALTYPTAAGSVFDQGKSTPSVRSGSA
jgi:hypothetical protein